MSITKGELAQRILKLIGVNSRFSDATPGEVQDVLKYANDWLMSQDGIGNRLGWNADADPDPVDETGLPDWSLAGVINSVAIYVCPYFDKNPHPSLMRNAAAGMRVIEARTVEIAPVQYPGRFPKGSGNITTFGRKFYGQVDRIITEGDFLSDDGGEIVTSGGGE